MTIELAIYPKCSGKLTCLYFPRKTVYLLFKSIFIKTSALPTLNNITKFNINARGILGREMKPSQFHGQLSNNWLPLLLTCWPNSPPWFSAHSRMKLFISTVRTIDLVYRLPPTIFQLTLKIGRRVLKINYSFGNYNDWSSIVGLSVIISKSSFYRMYLSTKIFFPPIPFASSLLPLSLSTEVYSAFGSNSRRDCLKPLLFRVRHEVSRSCIARFWNAPRMRGFVRICRP